MAALFERVLRAIGGMDAFRSFRMAYVRRYILPDIHARYSGMTTAEVFTEIYTEHRWGGEGDVSFTSGEGSLPAYTDSYCKLITTFIDKNSICTVVDIGCGDFQVGSRIARPGIQYIGVDVVEDLIAFNHRAFGSEHVRFQSADVTAGALPDGELCLIRQVFQHLSNEQILRALWNCRKYRYVIVTEHLPKNSRVKHNLDKPQGPDIRLYWNSGVFLDQAPFHENTTVLLEVPTDKWSVLRTSLIKNY